MIESEDVWRLYHRVSASVLHQVWLTACRLVYRDAGVSQHPVNLGYNTAGEEQLLSQIDRPCK
jgi:hypothetical protein